jgi:hypothetical protein
VFEPRLYGEVPAMHKLLSIAKPDDPSIAADQSSIPPVMARPAAISVIPAGKTRWRPKDACSWNAITR